MAVGGIALAQTAPYLESLATAYSACGVIYGTIERVRPYSLYAPTSAVSSGMALDPPSDNQSTLSQTREKLLKTLCHELSSRMWYSLIPLAAM